MDARVAVIGHFEWVTHTRGEVPIPGQNLHLHDAIEEPAGGGAVAASQMARLANGCRFSVGLAVGLGLDEAAALGAHCGALALTRRGGLAAVVEVAAE